MKQTCACLLLVLWTAAASVASAQQRPLVTEDPETIGAGNILIEGGFDSAARRRLSGVRADGQPAAAADARRQLRVQLDPGAADRRRALQPSQHHVDSSRRRLSDKLEFTGDDTSDVEDIVVATKIRFVSEGPGRPGIRRPPRDEAADRQQRERTRARHDGFLRRRACLARPCRSVRIVGNFGLGILSDPVEGDRQNDVLTYGLSFARALSQGFEFVGEINGRLNTRDERTPPGTETRSAIRAGVRFTHAAVRFDGGLIFGLTSRDPSFGFTGRRHLRLPRVYAAVNVRPQLAAGCRAVG